jgi:phosphatidylcholine synthase
MNEKATERLLARLPAWLVHLYTATGLVAAAGMAVLLVRGGEESFRGVIALMIVATVIDATDGTLARRWRVREVLPGFDGRRLDDIVDYQTYTSLPLLFIWRADILTGNDAFWLLLPLLASAYGFAQSDAKTDDHFFLGFPSYWNVVAIYLYWLQPGPGVALAVIISLALLTFVPSLYLYPSYRGPYSQLTRVLCAGWAVLLALIVGGFFRDPHPVYYFVISWWITLRRWVRRPVPITLAKQAAVGRKAEKTAMEAESCDLD